MLPFFFLFSCLKHRPGHRRATPLGTGRGLHAVGRKGRTSVPVLTMALMDARARGCSGSNAAVWAVCCQMSPEAIAVP